MGWVRDPLWWEIMKDRPTVWFPMQDYFSSPNNEPVEAFGRYILTQGNGGYGWNDKVLIRGANKFLTYNGGGWHVGGTGAPYSPHAGAGGKMTIEMMLNPASFAGSMMLVSKGAANKYEYDMRASTNGTLEVHWSLLNGSGDVAGITMAAGTLTASTPYHIATTYDRAAAVANIYLNGGLVAQTTTFSGNTTADTAAFHVGHRADNGGATISGGTCMGHLALYDTVLSAGRVAAHAAAARNVTRRPRMLAA